MASTPNNQFWIDYLDSVKTKFPWYYTKHLYVMNAAGPSHLDYMVKQYGKSIGYIPYPLIHACCICDKNCKYDKNKAYLQSLTGESWNGMDTRIINFFLCNWKDILIITLILLCFLIWYIRGRFQTCKRIANACGVDF
jgi:mannosyltransferase OCH1-like enzyme